jgi:ribosomal protein L11 methyltransferase
MWCLRLAVNEFDRERVIGDLYELGTCGIEEHADHLVAYFTDETVAAAQKRVGGEPCLAPEPEHPEDRQQGALEPILIGRRFVVVPPNQAEAQKAATPERIVLGLDAAAAFGSGRHETTQMCMEALESLVAPDMTILDIGCGSGVLARAAQELGARRVIGVDIDELSTEIARRHFFGPLVVGSADCFASNCADLVIANITGPADDRIAGELKRVLRPYGQALISGFTVDNPPQRYREPRVLQRGDWLAWICLQTEIGDGSDTGTLGVHPSRWWL